MWFFKRQLCSVEDEDSHLPPSALCLGLDFWKHFWIKVLASQRLRLRES